MNIENTSKRDPLLHLAAAMFDGSTDGYITGMEADGQRQLVHSTKLPVKLNYSTEEEFTALGFTFGEIDPNDDLFREATLPEGWIKEGSDHAMWSYVKDPQGRVRVSIFYKAAWYDRDAFMSIESVSAYVYKVLDGKKLILDDEWATRDAVVHALEGIRKRAEEHLDYDSNGRYAKEIQQCDALLMKIGGSS